MSHASKFGPDPKRTRHCNGDLDGRTGKFQHRPYVVRMKCAGPASTNAFSTETTIHLRSAALGFCLSMLAAAPLHAAIIQTFTDQAAFTAAVSIPPGNTVSIGTGGAAPNITVNGT